MPALISAYQHKKMLMMQVRTRGYQASRVISGAVFLMLTALLPAHGQVPTPRIQWPWPTWTPTTPAVPPSTTGKTYYVDAKAGSDTADGASASAAFKTIARAISVLDAGDTILIRAGLYREPIDLSKTPRGSAPKPITIGSYGDGEVIIDGSTKVAGWSRVDGTIWRANISFTPLGVVVNEMPLRQLPQGQSGSKAPEMKVTDLTSGSGKWHFANGVLTADMGAAIGRKDPNLADIVVPNNVRDQQHVYFYQQSHVTFKGLTIRGAGANGIWGYGSNITVDHCNIKFNGKAAVLFLPDSTPGVQSQHNAVINSHIYHNVLANWPRGNNGYAESGGGWPATVSYSSQYAGTVRGNIIHMNGGEGIAAFGSSSGKKTGSTIVEQNVLYDNWSMNLYFDNQAGNTARSNLLFHHPIETANFLHTAKSGPYATLGKYSVCLGLADEQTSSDATNGYANLKGSRVYSNIMIGCRAGIYEYAEGKLATLAHGLKDTLIANNTIILPQEEVQSASVYGIYLRDNTVPSGANRNTNSRIVNNIVIGFSDDPLIFLQGRAALDGVELDNNFYQSPSSSMFAVGGSLARKLYDRGHTWARHLNFLNDAKRLPGADAKSKFGDAKLGDLGTYRAIAPAQYDPNFAKPSSNSPVLGGGKPVAIPDAVNFEGKPIKTWNIGAY